MNAFRGRAGRREAGRCRAQEIKPDYRAPDSASRYVYKYKSSKQATAFPALHGQRRLVGRTSSPPSHHHGYHRPTGPLRRASPRAWRAMAVGDGCLSPPSKPLGAGGTNRSSLMPPLTKIPPRCITMAIGRSCCCEMTCGEPESRSRQEARGRNADLRGWWAWREHAGARLAPPAFLCVTGDAEPPGSSRSGAWVSNPTSGHLYGESAFHAATAKPSGPAEMEAARINYSGGRLRAQHVGWVLRNFGGLWDCSAGRAKTPAHRQPLP